MATALRENFGKLLEPGHRKIFYENYDQIPSMIDALFNVSTTDNPYEEDVSIGTFGEFPRFEGAIEYDRPYQGYTKRYEFPEFADGYRIERKLWKDDRYNIMNKRPAGLGIAAKRRRESDAAAIFNHAFDTGTAWLGGDSKPLCASDHPSMAYVEAGDGPEERSNAGTLVLNHANLQITKNLMRQTLDDRGGKISVVPDTLLVPVALEEMAWQLIESAKKIDTADNNPNIHYGKYRLIVWDYLEGTTEANSPWFLIDSNYANMFLMWFDREPLEFAMQEDFNTLMALFRAYMRYEPGFSDWIWIYGQDPS